MSTTQINPTPTGTIKTPTENHAKKWARDGKIHFLRDIPHPPTDRLHAGVYNVRQDPRSKELYLEQSAESFVLPVPLYGCETDMVKRVLTTWNSTRSNLGVLSNGIKGTGKTVTSQIIANELGLPVIVIDKSFGGDLVAFLAEIPDDVVFFFDEFEKSFKEVDSDGDDTKKAGTGLLSLMDGVHKTDARRLFLLTTNELHVEPNLIQRPGRIRYVKTFNNLSRKVIEEIVDDRLFHRHRREALIHFIAHLELITVDIVTALVDEVNIHDEDPEAFAGMFNVRKYTPKWDVFEIIVKRGENTEKSVGFNCRITPEEINENEVGSNFYVKGRSLGTISEVSDDHTQVTTESTDYGKTPARVTSRTFRLEPAPTLHASFRELPEGMTIQAI